jgi:hypothetical protein
MGSTSCPCVADANLWPDGGAATVIPFFASAGIAVAPFPLPRAYGSAACKPWDAGLPPSCNTTTSPLPAWCAQQWCYVDRAKCLRSAHRLQRSEYFPQRADLFFSYSTCQPVPDDSFREFMDAQKATLLGKRRIAVAIPALYAPTHYKRSRGATGAKVVFENSTGHTGLSATDVRGGTRTGAAYYNRSLPFHGSITRFLRALEPHAARFGIEGFDLTEVSAGARAAPVARGSAWTAAVYDVGAGLADAAASTFWVTPERVTLSSHALFTTSIAVDAFYLWVPRPVVRETTWDVLLKIFKPFDSTLWAMLCGLVLGTMLLNLWLVREEQVAVAVRAAGSRRNVRSKSLVTLSRAFSQSLNPIAPPEGDGKHDGNRALAHMVSHLGFGCFVTIILPIYTANLAAFLTHTRVGQFLGTIKEAIDAGTTICVEGAALGALKRQWPHSKYAQVDLSQGGIGTFYRSAECGAIVWPLAYPMRLAEDADFMCSENLVAVQNVFTMEVAFPASPSVAGALSAAIEALTETGQTYRGFEAQEGVQEFCPATKARWTELRLPSASENGGLVQLTIKHLLLPIIVWAIAIAVSARRVRQRRVCCFVASL